MLASGVADAAHLKPHALPFQFLDPLNFLAVVLCLMVGTASLPNILMRYVPARSVREARTSVTWSLLIVVVVTMSLPAYAAFAKLEIYSMLNGGTRIDRLPNWVKPASDSGLVSIFGVSGHALQLAVGTAKAAVSAGASDAGSVVAALVKMRASEPWYVAWSGLSIWPEHIAGWSRLDPTIQELVFRQVTADPSMTADRLWQPAVERAANIAGAADGKLRYGDLAIGGKSGVGVDGDAAVLALPAMAGLPYAISALAAIGALAAALSAGVGLLLATANSLSHDIHFRLIDPGAPAWRRLVVARVLLVIVAIGVAVLAASRPADILTVVVGAFSLAAAGLFPALVAGIWWKRANWAGCIAAMLIGFGVCAYYLFATRYFAVSFFETWKVFSNATKPAVDHFGELKQLWLSAAPGTPKDMAYIALDAHTRTLANWFGIRPMSAAVFGLPAGLLTLWLVSLLTPAPRPQTNAFVDELRRPIGAPVACGSGTPAPPAA
jgi:Na+(H+)/acetate symporter ActP